MQLIRAQCIVHRNNKVLMVRHEHDRGEWWCLPGGRVEEGETKAEAALRELQEECDVEGEINRQVGMYETSPGIETYTYLVDIGSQEPSKGGDPEFPIDAQILADVRWLGLNEIPERDRAYLWAAGLLCVNDFLEEISSWGDATSYPGEDGY